MVIKIIKDCLYSVAHLEVNKKVPQLVKQPMYMSQKSHNKSFAKE